MRSPSQCLARSVGLTIALAVALPGAGALAADTPVGEGDLCDLISPAINELSAMQFGEPAGADPLFCYLSMTDSQKGWHSVILSYLADFTIDDVREVYAEATEIMVGDKPGVLDGTVLYVGAGGGVLMLDTDIEYSAENDGIDTIEFATAVAELAVAGQADPLGPAATVPDEDAIVLPEVAGITWHVSRDVTGDEFEAGLSDEDRALWSTLLDAAGGGFDGLRQIEALAVDADSGERRGGYSGFRIDGAEEARLREAILELMRATSGQEDLAVEDVDIDGRLVIVVNLPPDQRLHFYVIDGMVHAFDLPDEDVAAVIAALP